MLRGDAARAQAAAEQEIAICEEYLLPLLLSQGQFQLGWALYAQGALDDGIARMQQGLEAIDATGAQMGRPYFSALFAEALAKSGKVEDGLAQIDHALAIVERDQAYFQLPEIRRLKGALLLQLPRYDLDDVAACFRGAMATASEQGAPIGEARAAISLARLLLHKGRRSEARRLLSELGARMSGMPDCAELREARDLLAE
jgi:predicted ATPase